MVRTLDEVHADRPLPSMDGFVYIGTYPDPGLIFEVVVPSGRNWTPEEAEAFGWRLITAAEHVRQSSAEWRSAVARDIRANIDADRRRFLSPFTD